MRFIKEIIVTIGIILNICSLGHAAAVIKAVATIGQIADMVENIGGARVSVEALMGPGVDPHLYRASESDVRKLSSADIIFYNGLHLEAKMGEIFERMGRNKKTVAVTGYIENTELLSDAVYKDIHDPHVWFDVLLWIKAAQKVRDSLIEFDPTGQESYEKNAAKYIEELQTLHNYVQTKAQELEKDKRVLVTAHDAFRYFGRRYKFEVVGLQGISTESEAGTQDVIRLADYIASQKIKSIFVETSVSERNIKAVQEAVRSRGWDVSIGGQLYSDALGSQGTKEGTYIGMVEHNINTIVGALK